MAASLPRFLSRVRSGESSRAPLRTQTWVSVAGLLSLPPMVIAHLLGAASVNPVSAPLSDYVWMPGGYLLVWFSASMLAGGGVILAYRVHRLRVERPELGRRLRWANVLLISFALGLFVAGVLPTDLPEAVSPTMSANIHRIGAGWALLALPAAGLLLARIDGAFAHVGYQARVITVGRWLFFGVLIALLVHFALMIFNGAGLPAFGLFERVGFAVLIQQVIMLGFAFGNQHAGRVRTLTADRSHGRGGAGVNDGLCARTSHYRKSRER